jgi:hypothetical protein
VKQKLQARQTCFAPEPATAIRRLLAVEGMDVILIGPRDLSATLGKLNEFDEPRGARADRSHGGGRSCR